MVAQGKHESKNQFVELRARGLSYASIAKKLKVAKATSWKLKGERT